MQRMKAMAQQGWSPEAAFELVEVARPVPAADDVLVKVVAASVNPVDWKLRKKGPLRVVNRLVGPGLPLVPGVDFAGVVEAVGARVEGVKVGARVAGGTDFSRKQRGSYAEYVSVRPDQIAMVPDELGLEDAAANVVVGVTAWMSLMEIGRLGSRPAGAKVLVLGASGAVGQFAVQLARSKQARVVGVCSTANVERVRTLGADVVIDYRRGDALEQARAHGPFEIIVDCVGVYSAAGCRKQLASGGRHVQVSGEKVGQLVQFLVPPFTSRPVLARSTPERLEAVLSLVASGKARVEIAQRLPLSEAARAHALSEDGRLTGKLVLIP